MVTAGELRGPLSDYIMGLGLVDHHVHGALRAPVERASYEEMITEAPAPPSVGTAFDSQVGFAIRRWCAPLIGLEVHADAEDYWTRRCELAESEVSERLLRATGTDHYLIETGYLGDAILDVTEMAAAADARASEVVRLETVAEELLSTGATASEFVEGYADLLADRTKGAVGLKSIVAYRYGFDFEPERPERDASIGAVQRIIDRGEGARVADPDVLRFLLWSGIDRGLPLQLHSGYGDPDLDLHRANPLLLMPWLRMIEPSGVPVLLLHNYPYHREAGYLAQVFDNVYFDVGLGVNYVGVQSEQVIAESFELGPFRKQLFSSDAWGPAELHLLGAVLWRRGVDRVVGRWVDDGDWSRRDAERVLRLVASENAERVYRL